MVAGRVDLGWISGWADGDTHCDEAGNQALEQDKLGSHLCWVNSCLVGPWASCCGSYLYEGITVLISRHLERKHKEDA